MFRSSPIDHKKIEPKNIRDLFDQRTLGSFYLSNTLELLNGLIKLGIKPKEDGWRKYATAFLRTEDSRFTLGVFRLIVPVLPRIDHKKDCSRQIMLANLASFCSDHPCLWNTRLEWTRQAACIRTNPHLDITWGEFDLQGNLTTLCCFFDAGVSLNFDQPASPFIPAFIQAYNRTHLSGRQRPYFLMQAMHSCLENSNAKAGMEFAQRVLDSVFVQFETTSPGRRLDFVDLSTRPHPGGSACSLLFRIQPDGKEADLWFSGNHALLDGYPVMAAIEDLKHTWGVAGPMLLPPPAETPEEAEIFRPAHHESFKDLVYVQQYLNFDHLLEARAKLNNEFCSRLEENITVAGMVLWGLSRQPFLEKSKLTVVAEVPVNPVTGQPRTLGFVTGRPGNFCDGCSREEAFIRFQNHLTRTFKAIKNRSDLTYAMMRCQALVSLKTYQSTLAMIPSAVTDVGGIMTLTIIPTAEYCLAPGDDSKDTIVSIGNIKMPTMDGRTAGTVSIKTVPELAGGYREALFNAIVRWEM